MSEARGCKPFSRGNKLRFEFRDGPVSCECARGEANKVVAAAAQRGQGAARPPVGQLHP